MTEIGSIIVHSIANVVKTYLMCDEAAFNWRNSESRTLGLFNLSQS